MSINSISFNNCSSDRRQVNIPVEYERRSGYDRRLNRCDNVFFERRHHRVYPDVAEGRAVESEIRMLDRYNRYNRELYDSLEDNCDNPFSCADFDYCNSGFYPYHHYMPYGPRVKFGMNVREGQVSQVKKQQK